MISTQRLIAIVVLINLFTTIATMAYSSPTTFNQRAFDGTIEMGNEFANQASQDGEESTSINWQQESSAGNGVFMSLRFLGIFATGFVALPTQMFGSNMLDDLLAIGMILFRLLMWLLIGIEIYMVLKNRKTGG
jgi:hypothetical protein